MEEPQRACLSGAVQPEVESVRFTAVGSVRIDDLDGGPALAAEGGGLYTKRAARVRDDRDRAAADGDHCTRIERSAGDGHDLTPEVGSVPGIDRRDGDAAVGVRVCVCVCVCVGVGVGIRVAVGICVGVAVGICVGVAVGVCVGVAVRIRVGVRICIRVDDDSTPVSAASVRLLDVAGVRGLVEREAAPAQDESGEEGMVELTERHGTRVDTPAFILNNEMGLEPEMTVR